LHKYIYFGRNKLYLGRSIVIDETNTFELNSYSSIKTVEPTVLCGLRPNILALFQNLNNLRVKSQLSSLYSFRELRLCYRVGNAFFYQLHTCRQI